jgi:hypothetical protein
LKWYKHMTGIEAAKEKLLMKYGFEGYGLYNYCIELIAGALCSENITFELDHDAELLAYKGKMDSLKVEEIMKFCVIEKLFEYNKSSQRITCFKLLQLLDVSTSNNPEFKKMMQNIDELLETNSNYYPLLPEDNKRQKKRKEKKIKINLDEGDIIYECEFFKVYDKRNNNYKELHPTLNLIEQYKKARQWLIDNNKTMNRWTFITNWLNKAEEYKQNEKPKKTDELPFGAIRRKDVN